MEKSNKNALDSESTKMYFNNNSISDWNLKVKLVFQMIDETESINQLRCMQQECREEGRSYIIAYIDNRIEQLKEGVAV